MEAIFGSLLMFGIVWFAITPVKRRRLTPQQAAFHNQMLMNEWHKQGYRPYEIGDFSHSKAIEYSRKATSGRPSKGPEHWVDLQVHKARRTL